MFYCTICGRNYGIERRMFCGYCGGRLAKFVDGKRVGEFHIHDTQAWISAAFDDDDRIMAECYGRLAGSLSFGFEMFSKEKYPHSREDLGRNVYFYRPLLALPEYSGMTDQDREDWIESVAGDVDFEVIDGRNWMISVRSGNRADVEVGANREWSREVREDDQDFGTDFGPHSGSIIREHFGIEEIESLGY